VPPGCTFHERCPKAFERCRHEVPEPQELPGAEGAPVMVRCHLYPDGA